MAELHERNISPDLAAAAIGMSRAELDALVAGRCALTAPIADKLEKLLAIPAHLWLNLQQNYESDLKVINRRETARLASESLIAEYSKGVGVDFLYSHRARK